MYSLNGLITWYHGFDVTKIMIFVSNYSLFSAILCIFAENIL